MRTYGAIPTSLWSDPTFEPLSALAKSLALYLAASRHTNLIGCFHIPIGYVAADLKMPVKTVEKLFAELESTGFIIRDVTTSWVLVRDFLRWEGNAFANGNVGISAARFFAAVPDDLPLKRELARNLRKHARHFEFGVLNGFETVPGTVPEPSRNPEKS